MENASKGLLIAAAVLIAILIITFGIKIYTSTSDTQRVASDTGKSISDKTGEASGLAISEISGKQSQINESPNTSIQKIGDCITKDNYGDYIDLGKSVVGTSATTDDWRILYKDTTNNVVYAILADWLPNSTRIAANTGLNTDKTYGVSSETDNTLFAGLNHQSAWNSLISNSLVNRGVKVKGATTVGILMSSYNAKHGTSLSYTEYPLLYSDPINSQGIDTLYMPNSDFVYNSENTSGYWLASRGSDTNSGFGMWIVDWRGVVNFHYVSNDAYNVVRPVVSIPFNIQVTNNNGVWSLAQ